MENLINVENKHYEKIFVSIASYRDPELIPTIIDAIENAQFIDNIVFGICLQDTQSVLKTFPYQNSENFRIHKVLYTESKGVCWARKLIQTELLKKEKYYLQIDSHMRFVKDWDKKLMDQLNLCESKKPIISVYPEGYSPYDEDKKHKNNNTINRLSADRFYGLNDNKYSLFMTTKHVKNNYKTPQKTYFLAAGFLFTLSKWANECPYNNNIYFRGEEDYIMFESYKNNWDIFYTIIPIIFHFYKRKNENKIFSYDKEWYRKNKVGIDFLKKYIETEDIIQEFQKELGIDYKNLKVSLNLYNGYFSKKKLYEKFKYKIKRYYYEGGYFEKRYNEVWIEFKNKNNNNEIKEFKAFKQLSKKEDEFILFNYDEKIYIKINNKKINYGFRNKNTITFKPLYFIKNIDSNVDSFTLVTEQENKFK